MDAKRHFLTGFAPFAMTLLGVVSTLRLAAEDSKPGAPAPAPAPAPAASGQAQGPAPGSTGAAPAPGQQPAAIGKIGAPAPSGQGAVQSLPPGKRTTRLQVPPTDFSPPVLVIDEADFTWGSAIQGELIRHSFKISNKGGAPLTITQVKPSCGCTTAAKPDKPIEAGQVGEVTLEIDTKKFSGTIKKTADISSNASPTPTKVSMSGKVDPFFTVEPPAPKIDIVRGVPVQPIKITLKKSSSMPLAVKEVKTEQKILSAQLAEVQAGELYEVMVNANIGDNQSKYLSEQVHVKVAANQKELEIPILVSISVKERIDVQPRTSVYFSRNETKGLSAQGAAPIVKTLEIKSLGAADHTFKVTSVTFENQAAAPNFETKLDTVTEGKHYRLNVSMSKLPTDTKSRTIRDVIVLQTDDPTVKEIKITALAALQ